MNDADEPTVQFPALRPRQLRVFHHEKNIRMRPRQCALARERIDPRTILLERQRFVSDDHARQPRTERQQCQRQHRDLPATLHGVE